MKKRIFRSICISSLIVLLLTSVLISSVMYRNSAEQLKREVINEMLYVRIAVEMSDNNSFAYISAVGEESKNRITLISPEGVVLYDNSASTESMDNHLYRPEVQSAFKTGYGEVTRLSDTIGEETYYYAVKLSDGNVLRVACTIKTAFGIMGRSSSFIILIIIGILIISIVIARNITNSIINPINSLDLDKPLSNDTYEELSPLLNRMDKQSKKISQQLSELTAQQKEFDYITGSMNEGLIIFGENGRILTANKSARTMLGNNTGSSYLELCRDPDYIKTVEAALSGLSMNARLEKRGRIYQLSANPVEERSKTYAAVLFMVDITDKERGEKMRREFSANVSHELKTPLTSILGYAEIIGNGIAKKEDVPRFANKIHSEAARLLSLIEDIIRLSRLDEGEIQQNFTPVDLGIVCKTVISELSEKAKAQRVDVTFEGIAAQIQGSESVLHEMIYNLCDNAIVYNKEKGRVKVKVSSDKGKTVLSVSDTGIGIAPEDKERIFERFYRADKSHSKNTGGTGLGLSIVKHAALIHGGKITLESKLNSGTTVTIIFDQSGV